jgi:hypothetical protein
MNEIQYNIRRQELIKEMENLINSHCHLCAKARIRKIADLDFEYKGIDREQTKKSLGYNKL